MREKQDSRAVCDSRSALLVAARPVSSVASGKRAATAVTSVDVPSSIGNEQFQGGVTRIRAHR